MNGQSWPIILRRSRRMKINIYCDGSCDHRSRLGGIGVYMTDGEREWYISQGYKDTTISRMEGMALLYAIRSLKCDVEINATVFSDSEYVVKSFTENRLSKWVMIGWSGVKNVDMWLAIIKEIENHPLLTLKFKHIRGHQVNVSGAHVFGNAVADLLASYKTKEIYLSDKTL